MPVKPFVIAVTGSRSIDDPTRVAAILDAEAIYYMSRGYDLAIRLGDAIGADLLALRWARERGLPRTIFFADRAGYEAWVGSAALIDQQAERAILASDWACGGDRAGPIRNHLMIAGGRLDADDRPLDPPVGKADLLVAIWDGSSRGTRNAMATARNAGVFIHQHGGEGPITFRTPGPDDARLVEWRGAL